MFRISRSGSDEIIDVAQVDEIELAVKTKPGRYDADQIEQDPLPSGHTSCRWGVGIKKADASVVIERDPSTS